MCLQKLIESNHTCLGSLKYEESEIDIEYSPILILFYFLEI